MNLFRGVSTLLHSQRFLPASCWEYAAKHYVKISRFIPTKKTRPSTPSRLVGAGDLDLSVRFLFTFGDFLAVRIPEPDKIWKIGTLVFNLAMLTILREDILCTCYLLVQ